MNLLLTVLLNKTAFTASKTRFLDFWSIFGLETQSILKQQILEYCYNVATY